MKVQTAPSGLKLIRHQYCPLKKRGRRVVVATLPPGAREIPADVDALLNDAEKLLVQRFLGNLKHEEDRMARYIAAKDLPGLIVRATQYYLSPTFPIANLSSVASKTRDAYSGLLNAMVKAGVGRTRNRTAGKKTS